MGPNKRTIGTMIIIVHKPKRQIKVNYIQKHEYKKQIYGELKQRTNAYTRNREYNMSKQNKSERRLHCKSSRQSNLPHNN